jgi:two-component system, NtrC family, sensor kinase
MDILIAEDDLVSRILFKKLVVSLGHQAVLAGDGAKAWDLFTSNEFRMVITDWMMPNMDGLTLCRKIREVKLPHYIYIIIVTAKTEKEDTIEGLQAGADDYIYKPIDPQIFKARIQTGERILRFSGLKRFISPK